MDSELENNSFIGRLLGEVSWEKATRYRGGGRRRENVLTEEVFLPLSYLPREMFLGGVLRNAHGAVAARGVAASEVEDAEISLLPDEQAPSAGLRVQPDAHLSMPSSYVLIEAKRIGRGSFQSMQLAKEFIAVTAAAGERVPLLLLVLGAPPPVMVKCLGRQAPEDAVAAFLPALRQEMTPDRDDFEELKDEIRQSIAWTTWNEIAEVVSTQLGRFHQEGHTNSVERSIGRLADSVIQAVRWHS